jgi:pyruvate-ferredoxin/flavodoxin oxidoreductase
MARTAKITMDGNMAVAHIAYRCNEVCAIYPITPSSGMAELADQWANQGLTNIWGNIPVVQAMQSEGGAAGTLHGALQSGALTTTFTASQGLLLMIPNMFKIAGELTPTVFHVAARALATQALSIFGDHSDVMAARSTGFVLLSSACVQEAHDFALISQAASLAARLPFLHFFDGFRTSHEINTIDPIDDETIAAMIRDEWVRAHRSRALSPENPFIRGTAHNPDTFFQAREAANPFYAALPAILETEMARFAALTGRHYRLFDYYGSADAEHVLVLIGSGGQTARETIKVLNAGGAKLGLVQVRLFRPFSAAHFLAALPAACRRIAVVEQCKEPGAPGEPLYLDVVTTLANDAAAKGICAPRVIGGRYGLASKNFSPAMVKAIVDELRKPDPKNGFTVGISDDVGQTSLDVDRQFSIESAAHGRAVFYGLGADGTVGANKNSAKILAEEAGLHAQAYFVYDSHKSGAQTISHLRFGPQPINAPYLIESANFVACHKFDFIERQDLLHLAAPGAVFLLNTEHAAARVFDHLPLVAQQQILAKRLQFYVIDANRIAREAGLGAAINTILQTCFFALSGVLPKDDAIARIKATIQKTYGRKGPAMVDRNFAAVDATLAHLEAVPLASARLGSIGLAAPVPDTAPAFIRAVTGPALMGRGDTIPVSQMPVDGTYPSGTCAYEKRNIAAFIAHWDPDLCIQCGRCGFVCPHGVIQSKYFDDQRLAEAPASFRSAPVNARGFPQARFTLAVYLEDCTGCGLCVETCPVHSPSEPGRKAINIAEKAPLLAAERANIAYFESLPINDRARVDFANVRGVQFLEPTFAFSGACAGCGETPYLKLLSQLFGDRAMIANATGCSSIYGGNMPVTPWGKNAEGRGPAWSNSLFEDNAEFGLGFRIAADQHLGIARKLLKGLAGQIGAELAEAIVKAPQGLESEIRAQRQRVGDLRQRLQAIDTPAARDLLSLVEHFVRRSIWIVGGDGWAYDIGYGGLDHVLASGRDVNVLVLDTEVYSNTGGQASKATPLGAVAKFAAGGKRTARKDLAMQAIAYGNVYVAQVAMGANQQQTLQAFREAEAYDGPSLILAYSHCIAHGIDMRFGLKQQDLAVATGYWPLIRFNPAMRRIGENPFRLDSPRPGLPFKAYASNEIRYTALRASHPAEADMLLAMAQQVVDEKYRQYEDLAERDGARFQPDARHLKPQP